MGEKIYFFYYDNYGQRLYKHNSFSEDLFTKNICIFTDLYEDVTATLFPLQIRVLSTVRSF